MSFSGGPLDLMVNLRISIYLESNNCPLCVPCFLHLLFFSSQSIMASGESGAGKTESTKHLMRKLLSSSLFAFTIPLTVIFLNAVDDCGRLFRY